MDMMIKDNFEYEMMQKLLLEVWQELFVRS